MSAVFDSRVSVSTEVMSSMLPAIVPGIGEENLVARSLLGDSSGDAGPPSTLVDQQPAGF